MASHGRISAAAAAAGTGARPLDSAGRGLSNEPPGASARWPGPDFVFWGLVGEKAKSRKQTFRTCLCRERTGRALAFRESAPACPSVFWPWSYKLFCAATG